MSQKLRRTCLLAGALMVSQGLAYAALAQIEEGRPEQSTLDRGTQTDRTRTTQSVMSRTMTPQSFTTQAAVIGKAEIELGQLAMQKTQDPGVRDYAKRMVTDHQAADAKLQTIAGAQKLEMPQALDPEHEALKAKLAELQGAAFDREYSKAMAKGHDKAVALFESASQAPQMTPELKKFAAATLPTLKEHMEMAHSLREHEDQGP
jgi:putative membrane protein